MANPLPCNHRVEWGSSCYVDEHQQQLDWCTKCSKTVEARSKGAQQEARRPRRPVHRHHAAPSPWPERVTSNLGDYRLRRQQRRFPVLLVNGDQLRQLQVAAHRAMSLLPSGEKGFASS